MWQCWILTFSQTGWQRGALCFDLRIGRVLCKFSFHLSRRHRGHAGLLPVAHRPLEGESQTGGHVPRSLRTAAPEHPTLQLLPPVLADVQEDVGPVGVGGAVRNVLQVGLRELPARAQLFDLDVSGPHDKGVVLPELLPVRDTLQQVRNGLLCLLPVQRKDLFRPQVVHFEQRVAVGQGLRLVAAESAPQLGGRVLQGLHEVEGAEGHDAFQAGHGTFSRNRVLVSASPNLPPSFKWSVAASTAFIWNEADEDGDVSKSRDDR